MAPPHLSQLPTLVAEGLCVIEPEPRFSTPLLGWGAGRAGTAAELEAIVEAIPLAVVGLDLALRVVHWNATATRIFGYSREEVLGRPYPLVPPDATCGPHEIFEDAFRGVFARGQQLRRLHKDGTPVEVQLWSAPLHDDAGALCGLLGVLVDNAEQRRLEADLRQAQKMEVVGTLAGGVAHDFNNLLTVMALNAHLLLDELMPGDERRGYARELVDAVEKGTALTRRLLAFSRRQPVEPRAVLVNETVQGTERLLRRLLGPSVTLTTELAPDAGALFIDPCQLEQVIINLAVNARDAMPRGGPLSIRTRHAAEAALGGSGRSGERRGAVEIEVSDGGEGMPPDVLARIFEPFFTTKGNGTGLGLATVKRIVDECGGVVRCDSAPGAGASFRIRLPAVEPPAAAGGGDRRPQVALGGGETILLVEDDPAVRSVTERLLRQLGYQVVVAADGESALALAGVRKRPVDLLLVGCVLADMDGRELERRLRAFDPGVRTLHLGGCAFTDAGGRAALPKPFSPEELARQVGNALATCAGRLSGRA